MEDDGWWGRVVEEVLGGGGDSVPTSQARVSEGRVLDRGARPQPKPGWICMYFT